MTIAIIVLVLLVVGAALTSVGRGLAAVLAVLVAVALLAHHSGVPVFTALGGMVDRTAGLAAQVATAVVGSMESALQHGVPR